MKQKLKILFASYECAPFLKRGGLGDVALGLPKALTELRADCRVIMPKYKSINEKKYKIKLLKANIAVNLKGKTDYFNLFVSNLPQSKTIIYFIDHRFFRMKNIFGYKNDNERFLFFGAAILQAIKAVNFKADVVHFNDWQTGLVPLMLKKISDEDKFFKKTKSIYTIHNLGYQGKGKKTVLKKFNIESGDLLDFEKVNPMAQGIFDSDLVGTVSNTYAQEVLTKEYGEGLEKILQKRKKEGKLFGIVNGLDYKVFNPKTDTALKQKYDLKTIDKKNINKTKLQKTFNLKIDPNIPLIGVVSRLTTQKGLDLILGAMEDIGKMNCQFIIVGSGYPKYKQGFLKAAEKYPKKIAVKIGFNAKLAQEVYGGSDMFLMPSKYEPCGLGQLIAMRYGAVPIVRATGGLKDTVIDYGSKKATGFVFKRYDSSALKSAIKKALKAYDNKKVWGGLVKNCMSQDFSWEHAAKEYIGVYRRVVAI